MEATVIPSQQPPQGARVKVYCCGNFLGFWAKGSGHYCRRCKRVLIDKPPER